jgi:8-oxo-dGTP pyrophosphatase MutT (NUDIX family)
MRPSIPRRLRGAGLWGVDGHILKSSTLGHDRWAVVGGGVEPGEAAYQACEREFREELGSRCAVNVSPSSGTYHSTERQG